LDLREYLEGKGLQVLQVGNNLQADCPFCDDDRQRFGINNNNNHAYYGYWNCLNGGCGVKGRSIKSLQKEFNKLTGDNERANIELKKPSNDEHEDADIDQTLAHKYFNKIENSKRKAKDYLINERGFSMKAIKHFMLGSWKKKGYEYVSLPFWENGVLVNVKFRAIQFKDKKFKWRRITGGKSSLFHDEILDNQEIKEIFLCEAELDAIALWNAGFENVVAVTTGAKAMQPEWYERLERFERINLVYDNDVDGQDGAEKMAKRLGMNRCYNVLLPQHEIIEEGEKKLLKDANQYFWDKDKQAPRYTEKDFRKLVTLAKQFQVKSVMSLTDAYRELIKLRHTADDDELIGFITRWERVNRILPRSKPGYFVVVTANPKVGKTTWVADWFLDLGKQGIPTYIECCEMRQLRMAEKTIANAVSDFTHVDNLTELQIRQARFENPADIMYLGYPEDGIIELEAMCEKITNVVHRYGVKAVCFDHLHFLVRGDNVKDKIGEVTRRFKLLAEQLGILFVLIAQPRKVENNRVPTANDLKDSSSIYQDLDSLVILHRRVKTNDNYGEDNAEESKSKMETVTEVHVTSRWGDGGSCLLNFNGRKAKYFDSGLSYDKAVQKFREKYGMKSRSVKNKGKR
jgi:replicative DNA helicase